MARVLIKSATECNNNESAKSGEKKQPSKKSAVSELRPK